MGSLACVSGACSSCCGQMPNSSSAPRLHAEVTELLSNVIYQHRRRAGQGGRSPRKESPLGRAVVWRVLGWSQARCGFEGRRRSQGRKQHGSFQLVFAGSRIRSTLCKTESDLPSIEPSFSSSFPPPTQQPAALWSGRGERDSEHRVTAPHSHTPGAASPTNPPQPSNNHHHNTPNARNIHTHPPLSIDGVAADHVGRRKRCLFLCHAPPPWVDGRISPVEIASIDSRWRYTDPHFAHEAKEARVPPDWHCSRKCPA